MIYDVLVIGAGHAGVEAAVMSSRLGANVGILTFSKNDLGTMSCNPAMGGLGKGHLIREIDAMGGIMGIASDRSGIQFRMLALALLKYSLIQWSLSSHIDHSYSD